MSQCDVLVSQSAPMLPQGVFLVSQCVAVVSHEKVEGVVYFDENSTMKTLTKCIGQRERGKEKSSHPADKHRPFRGTCSTSIESAARR